jgi:hypothetical protein
MSHGQKSGRRSGVWLIGRIVIESGTHDVPASSFGIQNPSASPKLSSGSEIPIGEFAEHVSHNRDLNLKREIALGEISQ